MNDAGPSSTTVEEPQVVNLLVDASEPTVVALTPCPNSDKQSSSIIVVDPSNNTAPLSEEEVSVGPVSPGGAVSIRTILLENSHGVIGMSWVCYSPATTFD